MGRMGVRDRADAFAFVHTGYAAVAALHDVVAAEEAVVLRHTPGDPHPISYIRVLLGVEMCRQFYGAGPWDDLAQAWVQLYPLEKAPAKPGAARSFCPAAAVDRSELRCVSRCGLWRAAARRPDQSGTRQPQTLLAMEQELGAALYTSMHWVWTEALRLLALTGLRIATTPEKKVDGYAEPEEWLLRLGGALQAA